MMLLHSATGGDAAQLTLWPAYVLAMLLLLVPGLFFLRYGAQSRREEIIGNFNNTSAKLYLDNFHPEVKNVTAANALEKFLGFYNSQFGLSRFLGPMSMLYATALVLGAVVTLTGIEWLRPSATNSGVLNLSAVLAILGGYTWVTYDQIIRAMRADLTPRSQLIGVFRLLIAVPMAYSIASAFQASLAVPLAFLLGTFPTETVMTIARRGLARILGNDALGNDAQIEIQRLASVDVTAAERFAEEGITSVLQLAYSDPVRLAIRTNLGFSYIAGCQSEALLWIYLRDKTPLLNAIAILGAYEVRSIWYSLPENGTATTSEQSRANAVYQAVLNIIAANPNAAAENLFFQVAEDPYTEFLYACWAQNMQNNPDPAEGGPPNGNNNVPTENGQNCQAAHPPENVG